LGCITQVEEGRYYLEDLTGTDQGREGGRKRRDTKCKRRTDRLIIILLSLPPSLPPAGHIPLDFSDLLSSQKPDTSLLNGLFTENSLVLVGGQVLDDVFRVWNMGFPFPEAR